jgi:hypothetical protein
MVTGAKPCNLGIGVNSTWYDAVENPITESDILLKSHDFQPFRAKQEMSSNVTKTYSNRGMDVSRANSINNKS